MDEMIRYIFDSLSCSEKAMTTISKILKRQKSFNRNTVIFMGATVLYMIAQDMDIRRMRKELENLKTEIKELGNTEGD